MRRYTFVTVDVFTATRFGGNPLAVFASAEGLSDEEMQRLAAEFNLSETVFVLPPADRAHTARVRIFNPVHEMPFAGHPNVGTALVLAEHGRDADGEMLFEELAGLVRVRIDRRPGEPARATIEAPEPLRLGGEMPVETVAACASLAREDLLCTAHRPVHASVGYPFLFAEVRAEALDRAAPDPAAFRAAAEAQGDDRLAVHLYAHEGDGRIAARMFSPLAGITEDPATGSANAALGALLLSLGQADAGEWQVAQGVKMGRPSALCVRAWRSGGDIRASVGGTGVRVMTGEVEL